MDTNRTIGKLPPRYSFILNPYTDERISKCPQCGRSTYLRKFVLFIHIDAFGPVAIGKTCRYCSKCELIVAHQDELETELTINLSRIAVEAVGNSYLVIGTMRKAAWKQGIDQHAGAFVDSLNYVADFERVLDLKVTGGWGSA